MNYIIHYYIIILFFKHSTIVPQNLKSDSTVNIGLS
jgi:hypothetical protein